jgi:predicted metal-dependent hydrolase
MVDYTLREHPRARRIIVSVRRDGTVWVTKPRRVSLREAETFVEKCGRWIDHAREKFSKLPKTSRIEPSKKEYEKYKGAAHAEVARRISRINSFYQLPVSKVVIRNQKSRWGSCSHKGVLSFNYRILFLSDRLADYIVAHELCHVREMNHSKRFWVLVARAVPDHLECRKELRKRERGLLYDS